MSYTSRPTSGGAWRKRSAWMRCGRSARPAQVGYGSEAGSATYRSLGFTGSATDTVYRRGF